MEHVSTSIETYPVYSVAGALTQNKNSIGCRFGERLTGNVSPRSHRHARIRELLFNHTVDPLTVAAQTRTSIAMIEKAYLRFSPATVQEKLAALKG